jgi:Di-haem oxidoreductase, putative peroxidase
MGNRVATVALTFASALASACAGGGRDGDPQTLAATIDQAAIDRGAYSGELLFDTGLVLFTHAFTCAEGAGLAPDCRHDRMHGPESAACLDCHNTPVRDGGGTLATNVFRGGSTFADSIQRNTPHLFGAGYVDMLAFEINRALADTRDGAVAHARSSGADVTVELRAKGLAFGSLTAHASGAFDVAPVGIDRDLIVKPWMAKGFVPSIRAQNLGAFPGHLGIEPTELAGVGVDGDGDGVVDELSAGRLSAVVAYEALLAAPTFVAASTAAERGGALFGQVGCAGCHTPLLRLDVPRYFLAAAAGGGAGVGLSLDLADPTDGPRLPRTSDAGPVLVPLFSDLRRHDMGPALADPIDSNGVAASVFLTTRLWGVGSTAPYLHDGRAPTLDDAIRAHGGEAQAARDAYAALDDAARAAVIDFLSSLVLERRHGLAALPAGVEPTY